MITWFAPREDPVLGLVLRGGDDEGPFEIYKDSQGISLFKRPDWPEPLIMSPPLSEAVRLDTIEGRLYQIEKHLGML